MLLSYAGWVLVGGRSRRMGSDKALLSVHEQPMAVHAAELLKPFTSKVTLVGDPCKYSHLELPVISDRRPETGPLAGIETVLFATESEWNFILACDVPGITPDVLRALQSAVTEEVDAVIPCHLDGRIEPLCGLYRRTALPRIRSALDSGTRRVNDVLALLTLRYLQVADPQPFRNLNTPDDLERYRHG